MKEGGNEGNRSDPSYRHTVITRVKWKHQLHSYTKLGNRTVCRNQPLQHFHTELRIKGHSALQWSAIDCLPFKCGCGPSYRHTVITRVKWKHQLHSYTKLGNRTVCRNQPLQHFHTELRIKGHSALQWSAIDCLPFKCGRGHPGSLSTDQLWGDTQRIATNKYCHTRNMSQTSIIYPYWNFSSSEQFWQQS